MDVNIAKYTATFKISTKNIYDEFGFMDPSMYRIYLGSLDKLYDIMSECIWEEIELGGICDGAQLKVDYTVTPIDNIEEVVAEGTKYVKIDTVVRTDEPSGFIRWQAPDGLVMKVRPPHIFKVDREKSKWYTYEYEKD